MKIDRYTLLDELGQGAMATVYRAHDPLIDRKLAIKTVLRSRLQAEGNDALKRFLHEAHSAGRLTHPGIVTIYDVGETDDAVYIAMELLDGPTLRETLDTHRLALIDALRIAHQLAEALEFAHRNGVIHRDIKPGNVLLAARNRVKLADFGIAQIASLAPTDSGAMQGSPRYMSPEQARGQPLDPRTDIFSLGAVIYEMLTGRFAFNADTLPGVLRSVLDDTPPSPEHFRNDLPSGLATMTMRLLEKAPDNRPSLRELLDMLELCNEPPHARPSTPTRRHHALLAIALPLALVLTGGGIAALLQALHDAGPGPATGLPQTTPVATPNPDPDLPPDLLESIRTQQAPLAGEQLAEALTPPDTPQTDLPTAARTAPGPAQAVASEAQIKRRTLEKKRNELLLHYTPRHPDVRLIDRQIELLDSPLEP